MIKKVCQKLFLGVFLLAILALDGYCQPGLTSLKDCNARLEHDTLTLENNRIRRVFLWNDGRLITKSILNKSTNTSWLSSAPEIRNPGDKNNNKILPIKADFSIPGLSGSKSDGTFSTQVVPETNASLSHLQVEIITIEGALRVRKVFKIYPDCPAIACDFYLKGTAGKWSTSVTSNADMRTIESESAKKEGDAELVVLDKLQLPYKHWKGTAVEFFDVTDRNNNLVNETSQIIYVQESRMKGNLLLLQQKQANEGLFYLKEAPLGNIQLDYPGFDYTLKGGEIKMVGLGLTTADLNDSIWVKGYSAVTGVSLGKGEAGLLSALKTYQENLRTFKSGRDQMIMSNTWGDRGQDGKINEGFVSRELSAGSRLGITHFQIDDGWQSGRSSNSLFQGGSLTSIWRNPNYWEPDPVKFPNGLKPVIDLGKKLGIQISTWFNPSTDSNFKYWEKDADVLINQYKKYGIKIWKIDGVNIANKYAEINFRKLLDKVMQATDNQAVFDLDVTGGRRFGYHYFYEYGNLFLENRYTDFASYYPYYTLRNLWMLSKYVPSKRLQIEFLNKWRNTDKYPQNDVLAPSQYSFDYLFAITMFAQPLAWFETSGLPPEAFTTSALISVYKQHWVEIHNGQIFPIGQEPDGYNWTGFQSVVNDSSGYVLIFRDNAANGKEVVKTYLDGGKTYQFTHVAGSGESFSQKPFNQNITFTLPKAKSFALYKYQVVDSKE